MFFLCGLFFSVFVFVRLTITGYSHQNVTLIKVRQQLLNAGGRSFVLFFYIMVNLFLSDS